MSETEKGAETTATAAATETAPAPARKFVYNGMELPDIDASMKPEQIRDVWAGTYPELQNAKVKGPEKAKGADGVEVSTFTFVKNVGHLG